MDRPLLSRAAMDLCFEQGVQAAIERSLAALNTEGLPYAQPTTAGEDALWKPLEDFTVDEATALLGRRIAEMRLEHNRLMRLHRWCWHRFGVAPTLPAFDDISELPETNAGTAPLPKGQA